MLPEGFVYIQDIIPSVREDIRYAGDHNFVGCPVDGYFAPKSVLQECAVQCVDAAGGIPLAGPVSRENPRVLVIGGLGVNGLTQSAIASDVLLRQITGQQLPESALFSPIGDFQRHAASPVSHHRGRMRDAGTLLFGDAPRCPHMGCRMRWNSARQLWECPCHGSNFTSNGECHCAPAAENAHIPDHMRRK